VNSVSLIGNLATDVELKEIAGDKKVANFLLAVPRPTKDSEADFVGVSVWDRQAETCAEFLSKGKRVAVDGRLKSRSWDENGKRRTVVEVVANRVQFLSPPAAELAEVVPFERAVAG
jgi:single-strand DNA-binding protein